VISVKLGRYLIASTTLKAGTGAEVLFRVFTAGEKPVWLMNAHYYGGDISEGMQLFVIPPNAFVGGLKPSDQKGAIAITNAGVMSGGKGTIEAPSTILGAETGLNAIQVIPPFASIACSLNASNTAAMTVTLGGFEFDA